MNTHTHTLTHTFGSKQTQLIQQNIITEQPILHFPIHSEMQIPNSGNHVTLKAGITLLLPVLYLDQKVRRKGCTKQISILQVVYDVSNTKTRHSIMPIDIY